MDDYHMNILHVSLNMFVILSSDVPPKKKPVNTAGRQQFSAKKQR